MILDEWRALKAHIDGLASLAQISITAHQKSSASTSDVRVILKTAKIIDARARAFFATHQADLPAAACQAFENYSFEPSENGDAAQVVAMASAPLIALGSEISYLLTDLQHTILVRSERAFSHLRRSIEANPTVAKDWNDGFVSGETACEKLGAAHLLLHGIFAFKVNAEHARTDLVYAHAVDSNEVSKVADGLVLTEWKKVASDKDTARLAAEAREQTKLYAKGALAGIELRDYRFIVLVSRQQIALPDDSEDGGVIYRHINIPVEPRSPSVASKKTLS